MVDRYAIVMFVRYNRGRVVGATALVLLDQKAAEHPLHWTGSAEG